jgi:RNase P/RNase MRP subunit POP5
MKILIKKAEGLYEQARGVVWMSKSAMKVNCEVNSLKHTSSGIISGRKVQFEHVIAAIDEILMLIEAFGRR